MITEFLVMPGEKAKRLDAFLVSHERGVSRSGLQRLIVAGRIRVNAQITKPSQKIKSGDRITMDSPKPGPMLENGLVVPLELLYEDDALYIVNKPAGVVAHPTSGHWNGTLLNSLLAYAQANGQFDGRDPSKGKPGLVHRLDKETSGVMVVTKTDQAHRALCQQFEKQTVVRRYEALLHGRPKSSQGTIDIPIGRDTADGKKVSTKTMNPQRAVTEYTVKQQFGPRVSHVELIPRTGRQHQLRVHVASLGCPILGDPMYGVQSVEHLSKIPLSRMMLHACCLGFQHPVFKTYQEYTSKLPTEFAKVLQTA